ncbi:hypothetical protein AA0488_0195 [Kozakia baliensis NRIC 0488]|nr:hypothetical protein AA0488_0195 [Kozakia baliensis NRIC 0488]
MRLTHGYSDQLLRNSKFVAELNNGPHYKGVMSCAKALELFADFPTIRASKSRIGSVAIPQYKTQPCENCDKINRL